MTGGAIALAMTAVAGMAFAAVALANDTALRDRRRPPRGSVRPTGVEQPPLCDGPLRAGTSARLNLHLSATVDLRPTGTVDLTGLRVGRDFRWLAYVATTKELGQYGAARDGDGAWMVAPGTRGWTRTTPATVDDDTVDVQALEVALTPDYRATAEDHGIEVIEGARARRCRVAIDGTTFRAAFPRSAGSSATPTSIAGAASSTTGSSSTASSARSPAAPTARRPRSSRTPSTARSTCA